MIWPFGHLLQAAIERQLSRERPRGLSGRAEFVVLTITPEELRDAKDIMGLKELLPQCEAAYFSDVALEQERYDVVLCQSLERTNVPAYEATAELIFQFRPEFILLVGTAGGVDDIRDGERVGRDHVALGDIVLADFIEYSEFRKIIAGKDRARHIPHDHPSAFLRRHAHAIAELGTWVHRLAGKRRLTEGQPKVVPGNILACEKIWGDYNNPQQVVLLEEFDKAIAIETESYGVAKAIYNARRSAQYNPQFLVIRGVSDMVNSQSNDADRKVWTGYAASAASAFALAIIERVRAFRHRSR